MRARAQGPIRWHNVRWDDPALNGEGEEESERDDGRLPDFFVVGAAKSGTTSLYYYLNQHPDIGMSIPKEPNFFNREDFQAGLDDYKRCFSRQGRVRGESSVEYTYHPFVNGPPERIHSVLPAAKIIYIVRDPVDRAEAHYHQRYCSGKVGPGIEKAFADLDHASNVFIATSMYAMQMDRYLRFFPRSALLVVDQNELKFNREETMRSVFSFLDVDSAFASDRFSLELNTRQDKLRMSDAGRRLRRSAIADLARTALPAPVRDAAFEMARRGLMRNVARTPLPPDVRRRVVEALTDDAQRFRELSGLAFAQWSA